ncbi:MAG: FAD-binding oxidoreductase, partial [Mesorhizobium sp.]
MGNKLPSHAEYLIIGGGIIGLSIAYHLTRLGHRDVLLLERDQLTCGTTWHAAGLVTQLRANETMARLAQYSAELFRDLEHLTG